MCFRERKILNGKIYVWYNQLSLKCKSPEGDINQLNSTSKKSKGSKLKDLKILAVTIWISCSANRFPGQIRFPQPKGITKPKKMKKKNLKNYEKIIWKKGEIKQKNKQTRLMIPLRIPFFWDPSFRNEFVGLSKICILSACNMSMAQHQSVGR